MALVRVRNKAGIEFNAGEAYAKAHDLTVLDEPTHDGGYPRPATHPKTPAATKAPAKKATARKPAAKKATAKKAAASTATPAKPSTDTPPSKES